MKLFASLFQANKTDFYHMRLFAVKVWAFETYAIFMLKHSHSCFTLTLR